MDKETLYAENKALRTMNLHLSDRTDVMEKAAAESWNQKTGCTPSRDHGFRQESSAK